MNFLRRMMYGRYGADQLGCAMLVVYLVLYVVSMFTRLWPLSVLSSLLAVACLYRMLSRNIPKRQRENARFLKITSRPRAWWRRRRMIHADKAHRYFKCPSCGQQLRVPRDKGKIKVTCRSCGTSFETKS